MSPEAHTRKPTSRASGLDGAMGRRKSSRPLLVLRWTDGVRVLAVVADTYALSPTLKLKCTHRSIYKGCIFTFCA